MDDREMRLAPANIEAEQALLGAILVNNDAYSLVQEFLLPEHFYDPIHKETYRVIAGMIDAGKSPNPVTVKQHLPEVELAEGMTVAKYLARMAAEAVTIINGRDYGEAILEMSIRRGVINACEEAEAFAYDLPFADNILDHISELEGRLDKLRSESARELTNVSIGNQYMEEISNVYDRGSVLGVPIAFDEIANVISEPSFEAGNLYGLLSSSGEGKTSLTLQLAYHAVSAGYPTLLLSYDQNSTQCVRQMIAQQLGIGTRKQRDPKSLTEAEWDKILTFTRDVDKMPLEIIRCSDQNINHLTGYAKTFCRRKKRDKPPLIILDHIGAVRSDEKRVDEGTKAKAVNRPMKAIAEKLGAAVLILNQRNSSGTRRENPRPASYDLFGAEPAKQDYDAIFYLYRYEKWKKEREAVASSDADYAKINKVFGVRPEDVAEIGAIKVRYGNPAITRDLEFEAKFTRYHSMNVFNTEQESLEL